jgi:hypothetical protein
MEEDYFHFNWGWSGSCDGYIYLNDLTPGSSDFTSNQNAVMGIRPGRPDLKPYKPNNWNDMLPVSVTQSAGEEDHTDSGPYYDHQTLYLNYGIANLSRTEDAGPSTVRIEVTGAGGGIFNFSKPYLYSYTYDYNSTDFAVGPLSAGTHTIKMWVDYGDDVDESDESNNYYERTVTVLPPPQPDLTPYQPSNWNDVIPISTTRNNGTDYHYDSAPYYDNQTLYMNILLKM